MTRSLLTLVIITVSSAALYAVWKPPKVQAQPQPKVIHYVEESEPPQLGRVPINPSPRNKTVRPKAVGDKGDILSCIARGESGNNPRAVSRTGKFRGLLQFSRTTWDYAAKRYGRPDLIGLDPIDVSAEDQWDLGLRLLTAEGPGHWPTVSRGCL